MKKAVAKKAAAKPAPAAVKKPAPKMKVTGTMHAGGGIYVDTVEPVKEEPKTPVDDGSPNEAYPWGIQFAKPNDGGFSYERYKTMAQRDKRFSVVGKGEGVCKIKHAPTVAAMKNAPAPEEEALKPAPAIKGPTLVKGAASTPAVKVGTPPDQVTVISKRVTLGAEIHEWRIARSVRVGQPGWFLQGGHHQEINGKKRFIVGAEEHFKSLHDAKEAMVLKFPPSDDPVETPAPSKKHVN